MKEEEIKRNRYQLAKHVYRMQIARAIRCSAKEARELFKEAMR